MQVISFTFSYWCLFFIYCTALFVCTLYSDVYLLLTWYSLPFLIHLHLRSSHFPSLSWFPHFIRGCIFTLKHFLTFPVRISYLLWSLCTSYLLLTPSFLKKVHKTSCYISMSSMMEPIYIEQNVAIHMHSNGRIITEIETLNEIKA